MAILKNINHYTIKKGESFVVDTNIWIYLSDAFSIRTNQSLVEKYSIFIDKLIENDCKIYILSLGVSELFNRYIKETGSQYLRIKKIRGEGAFKKYYRPSPNFEKDKKYIIDTIKEVVLELAEPIADDFINLDIDNVLDAKRKDYDFNDNYFAQFCAKNNYKLLTHDSDFSKYKDVDFEILTLNC